MGHADSAAGGRSRRSTGLPRTNRSTAVRLRLELPDWAARAEHIEPDASGGWGRTPIWFGVFRLADVSISLHPGAAPAASYRVWLDID
jgi:hypothetical protein